jgi:hypothetical protein
LVGVYLIFDGLRAGGLCCGSGDRVHARSISAGHVVISECGGSLDDLYV